MTNFGRITSRGTILGAIWGRPKLLVRNLIAQKLHDLWEKTMEQKGRDFWNEGLEKDDEIFTQNI